MLSRENRFYIFKFLYFFIKWTCIDRLIEFIVFVCLVGHQIFTLSIELLAVIKILLGFR